MTKIEMLDFMMDALVERNKTHGNEIITTISLIELLEHTIIEMKKPQPKFIMD